MRWCALWFWPIERAELLPTRHEFLFELSLILEGNVFETAHHGERQLTMPSPDKFGFVDVDRLCRDLPRLRQVRELAERYRFLHWELEFADLFADRGGFDLVLGNRPWIKVERNEAGVMGDAEPPFVLRSSYTATQARFFERCVRASLLANHNPYILAPQFASRLAPTTVAIPLWP